MGLPSPQRPRMDTIPHPLPDAQTATDLYLTAIGDKNQDYYITRFEDFDRQGESWKVSWNWAAFLFTGVWALYRRMYGSFVMWWVMATILVVFEKSSNAQIHQALAVVVGVLWLGFGAFANALYHRKVRARMAAALKASTDAARVTKRLRVGGGVHAWVPIAFGGIPVIGIVAAVALPAYQDYSKRNVSMTKAMEVPAGKLPMLDISEFQVVPGSSPQEKSGKSFSYEDAKLEEGVAASRRGDHATAAEIFRPLAMNGNSKAQGYLGSFYEFGLGGTKDYSEALKWYRMAAAQGHVVSQWEIGMMYHTGQGVLQDYTEAAKWIRLAATNGFANAQSQMGILYLMGQGVPQSDIVAHMWFNLGAASGDSTSSESRATVEKYMTSSQIALAQQMARDCQRRNFKGCE